LSRIDRIDKEFAQLIIDGESRVATYVVDLYIHSYLELMKLPMRLSFQINNLLQYHYVELIGNIAPIRNYTITLETNL